MRVESALVIKPGGRTEKLIEQLGVKERIRFVHGISSEEIRSLYAGSVIAISPSEYEGFGLPAGEAMACGTPLVATDGGALPEVVGDAGRIVPRKDPDALASAIAELLRDDQQRAALAVAGRNRIVECFSWQRAAAQMVNLYGRALQ